MKLSWNKFFCISKILDSECYNWKKIHFCPEILIFFFQIPYGYLALFSWKKRFSNFYFFLSIWSLDEIKLLKFGTFRIPIFPIGKKSTFVPKIGGFRGPKRVSEFYFFLSIWSLDEIKLLKFGTFWIPIFPIGKKSTFVPKFGGFGGPKRFSNFYYFFWIWSLGEIKLLKFGIFRIPIFPIGKKSTFVPKFLFFFF